MTFLTRAHELDKRRIPQELSVDSNIVKAIEAVDRMFNEEERGVYEVRMEAIADVESKIASAAEDGREKGRVQGRKEGKQEGKLEERRRIAVSLLDVIEDDSIVAEKTGLILEQVKSLREEKKSE